MKTHAIFTLSLVTLLFPALGYAQSPPTTFAGVVDLVIGLVNLFIPALFAVILLFFVWKMIDAWIISAGDERKVAEGKQYALWTILLVALMICTWGIVIMLNNSFF